MTREVSDYQALITSWHATRPKFVATVGASVEPVVETQRACDAIPAAFDLDSAVGVQLDIVGEWIGRDRNVFVPIQDIWFSLDDAARGFDKGIWKGPYDTGVGVSRLDDETYRKLLYAKVAANAWDGRAASMEAALRNFFNSPDSFLWVEDRMDMSVAVCVTGKIPSILDLYIMSGGYIPMKPAGVKTYYQIASIENAPLFGFDCSNSRVAGFDVGAWGVGPDYIAHNAI